MKDWRIQDWYIICKIYQLLAFYVNVFLKDAMMPQSVAMLKSRQLSSWSGVKKCFLAPYMRIILYIGKTPPALQDFCNYNAIAMQFLQYSTIKMYTVWGSKVPFQNYLQKHSNSGWNVSTALTEALPTFGYFEGGCPHKSTKLGWWLPKLNLSCQDICSRTTSSSWLPLTAPGLISN